MAASTTLAQRIMGYAGYPNMTSIYGFEYNWSGWAKTCCRMLHENTVHGEGLQPSMNGGAPFPYEQVYQAINLRIANGYQGHKPEVLCGDMQVMMAQILMEAGTPVGWLRAISSTGDTTSQGLPLFQDHALNYARNPTNLADRFVIDADYCVWYEKMAGLATPKDMCWVQPYLTGLIKPTLGPLSGWSSGAWPATQHPHQLLPYWSAVHDMSDNIVYINWDSFPFDENPTAEFITASNSSPRKWRDIIVSTCAPGVSIHEIGSQPS